MKNFKIMFYETTAFVKIHLNIILPFTLGSSTWFSFPSRSPTKILYTPILAPISATCHTLLIHSFNLLVYIHFLILYAFIRG